MQRLYMADLRIRTFSASTIIFGAQTDTWMGNGQEGEGWNFYTGGASDSGFGGGGPDFGRDGEG